MGQFDDLSPFDFELLVADLLTHELGPRFETFARGPDSGLDLRAPLGAGHHWVQCKHYVRSSFSQLKSAATKEHARFGALDLPDRYTFVTSRELTAANKITLITELGDLVIDESDVLGAEDLAALLRKHPQVERAHVKLWLRSTAQLQRIVDAETFARSEALLDDIQASLPRYVQTESFAEARALLQEHRVAIIAGPPGVGKTTLGRLLLLDAAEAGFVPYSVQSDIAEAWRLFSPDEPQAFFFDDFLGRTSLFDHVADDVRDLGNFVRRVRRSESTRLILSTREYVLQHAGQVVEDLQWRNLDAHKFALTLEEYSRFERGWIFYNHVCFSPSLTARARRALVRKRAYLRVIDHDAYSPRLIEWMTGFGGHTLTADDLASFPDFCVSVLEDPEGLWTSAFARGLDDRARCLLLLLPGLPTGVTLDDLERAYGAAAKARGLPSGRSAFDASLKLLQDSFIRIDASRGWSSTVSAVNPSLIDFLVQRLLDEPDEILPALRSACFFEQVDFLARLALGGCSELDGLPDAILAATRRTLRLPALARYWDVTDQGLAGRLNDIVQWCSLGPIASALAPLVEGSIPELIEETGRAGGAELARLPSLLVVLDSYGFDPRILAAAIKRRALELGDDVEAYDALAGLHGFRPQAFASDEWAQIRARFADWAVARLSESSNWFEDITDLSRFEEVAGALDVVLPGDLLADAWVDVETMVTERETGAVESIDVIELQEGRLLFAGLEDRDDQALDELDYADLHSHVLSREPLSGGYGTRSVPYRLPMSEADRDIDAMFATLEWGAG